MPWIVSMRGRQGSWLMLTESWILFRLVGSGAPHIRLTAWTRTGNWQRGQWGRFSQPRTASMSR